MIQAHVYYSGTVQGVGFRYTVRRLAADRGLAGWIRNLPDGRVEMLVVGEKSDIENLLAGIADYFAGYITARDVDYSATDQAFNRFMIIS